jgi:hypothetical protein
LLVVAAGCAGRIEGDPGGGGGTVPTGALLPARVRRLTNAEYDASVQALLGTSQTPAATSFPPDSRQSGYTVNDAQIVDPVLAKQLSAAAQSLADEASMNGTLAQLAPCSDPSGSGGEACARSFIQSFATRAYRRDLASGEADALVTVYHAAADGGSYTDGIGLVVQAALQSASFLYVTELGDGSASSGSATTLTPDEMASSLSFLVAAAPPDQTLLDAAASGRLATPDGREQEARRLMATPAARARLVQLVREWLGIDGIGAIAKDTTVYPSFAGVRDSMDAESVNFVNEVLVNSTGTVGELLGADYTVIDQPLAAVYGVTSAGPTAHTALPASTHRVGILNQGAFLATYAHASESAPVKRGVTVLRRVACVTVPSPTELNIQVTPPVPDPTKTTRERYAIHATDQLCASCHNAIDSIGFAFEDFDGMGALRATENNNPIDSSTTIAIGSDFDGSYPDSAALAQAIASSAQVRACVARQLLRGTVGRSDNSVTPVEDAFVSLWQGLPSDQQGNLVETLVAFIRSPIFAQRSVP